MGLTAGADALVFKISSAEVKNLNAVGTIAGAAVTFVSGAVGPGNAILALTVDAEGLAYLRFQAPGSSFFGDYVAIPSDGSYLICDGEDLGKFVRVTVITTKLPQSDAQARMYLSEVFDQYVAGTDASAAQASAGQVLDYSIDMYNQSNKTLQHVTGWIDPRYVALFQISNDNATWVSPVEESSGVVFADIAPAGTGVLYIRRTITAGAVADPDLLAAFKIAFVGGP